MRTRFKVPAYLIIFVLVFSSFVHSSTKKVFAEDVNVTIGISPTDINVGDTVTATITITGERLASYSLNISYTTGLLTCDSDEEGTGTITLNGEGATTLNLYMVAQGEGRATVSTSGYAFYDAGGSQLSIAHSSAPVNIGLTESSDGSIKIGNDIYTLVNEWQQPTPPEGYELSYITYNDEQLYAYQSPNHKIKIVSLQNAEWEQKWFVFDEESQEFSPFVQYNLDGKEYIIMNKPSDVSIPEDYTESVLTIDDYQIVAYKSDISDSLYLVYALGSGGNAGLYYYDIDESSFTRYDTIKAIIDAATSTSAESKDIKIEVASTGTPQKKAAAPLITPTKSSDEDEGLLNAKNLKMFLYMMSVLFIIMCVVVIILVVKVGLLQSQLDDEEEEEDDDGLGMIYKKAKQDADNTVLEEQKSLGSQVISRNKGYAINEDTGEILVEVAEDNNAGVNVPPAVDKKESKIENAMKERPFGIDSAFSVVSAEDAPEGDNVSHEPEPEEPFKIDEEKLRELRAVELKQRLAEEEANTDEVDEKTSEDELEDVSAEVSEEVSEEVSDGTVEETSVVKSDISNGVSFDTIPEKIVLPGNIEEDTE